MGGGESAVIEWARLCDDLKENSVKALLAVLPELDDTKVSHEVYAILMEWKDEYDLTQEKKRQMMRECLAGVPSDRMVHGTFIDKGNGLERVA